MGCVVFFFQAEDGIRDLYVTGVQTCALPIWAIVDFLPQLYKALGSQAQGWIAFGEVRDAADMVKTLKRQGRSEERRVGKECRARGAPHHEKKKKDEGEQGGGARAEDMGESDR